MAKQVQPVMSASAHEQLRRLDKETLIELVWFLVAIRLPKPADEHALLRGIDTSLLSIDARRRQRGKFLAEKFMRARLATAQGEALAAARTRRRSG